MTLWHLSADFLAVRWLCSMPRSFRSVRQAVPDWNRATSRSAERHSLLSNRGECFAVSAGLQVRPSSSPVARDVVTEIPRFLNSDDFSTRSA